MQHDLLQKKIFRPIIGQRDRKLYWQTLKTQHLDNSFNLRLEKEG